MRAIDRTTLQHAWLCSSVITCPASCALFRSFWKLDTVVPFSSDATEPFPAVTLVRLACAGAPRGQKSASELYFGGRASHRKSNKVGGASLPPALAPRARPSSSPPCSRVHGCVRACVRAWCARKLNCPSRKQISARRRDAIARGAAITSRNFPEKNDRPHSGASAVPAAPSGFQCAFASHECLFYCTRNDGPRIFSA